MYAKIVKWMMITCLVLNLLLAYREFSEGFEQAAVSDLVQAAICLGVAFFSKHLTKWPNPDKLVK